MGFLPQPSNVLMSLERTLTSSCLKLFTSHFGKAAYDIAKHVNYLFMLTTNGRYVSSNKPVSKVTFFGHKYKKNIISG